MGRAGTLDQLRVVAELPPLSVCHRQHLCSILGPRLKAANEPCGAPVDKVLDSY